MPHHSSTQQPSRGAFHTTRWTRVCLAQEGTEDGRLALAELCDAYYEPILAYLQCTIRDAASARDLAHEFFALLLAGSRVAGASPERGRFRSYLLGAVKHFLSHRRESVQRLKRGGHAEHLTLDDANLPELPDSSSLSPDAAFDRSWALTVLNRAWDALRLECEAEGKSAFFELAQPMLAGEAEHGAQASAAAACGLSPQAFRMALLRLKRRLRDCVKEEIAGTLDGAGNVQDEMEALFAALAK